ncbi:phage tail protein [Herbaspirillum frisingense]|uniref:Phage tail protein n=1 Tax=Herbaspirillum frisingense TaxID=92645 RepID=A0ABU1PFB4_9BURK|nr:phage tail protein [Herbaspirillum frisingense]MDR6583818.1 hypothetical protein [Herbaspirillum frisingense]
MKRISTATKVVDKFGPGKPGFTNGNAVTGLPATDLESDWFDHVQEEHATIVEEGGGVVDGSSTSQVLDSLQAMFGGAIGAATNLRAVQAAAASTLAWTADAVVVKAALAGRTYVLTAFNQTVDLTKVGVGGMDVGAAPSNGYVGIYAIANPKTGLRNIIAVNATAARAPEIYGGANMPAGYTHSALIGVWPTDATGKLKIGGQNGRRVAFPSVSVLSTTVSVGSRTALSIASAVPKNARQTRGNMSLGNGTNVSQDTNMNLSSDASGSCAVAAQVALTSASGTGVTETFDNLEIFVEQTIYYQLITSSGSPSYTVSINGYSF